MATYVVDRVGVLEKLRKTVTGGYLVDATLAKVGVLVYDLADGTKTRQYNPPEPLEEACPALVTCPVTDDHPPTMVDTENYSKYSAGHVVGTPEFKDGHLRATLAIHDAKLIKSIARGEKREVSMGYSVNLDETPGVTDAGEAYDSKRTLLQWNHIAVVPTARAGKSVRLMLDSTGAIPGEQVQELNLDKLPTDAEKLGAVRKQIADLKAQMDKPRDSWEVMRLAELEGLEAVLTKVYKVDGSDVAAENVQSKIDALAAERDAAKAELDALKAKTEKLDAELAAAKSPEAFDAAIKARDEKVAKEKAEQERVDAVKAAYPSLSLDGKSSDYVMALFDGLKAKAESADAGGAADLSAAVKATVKDAAPAVKKLSAREQMLEDNRKARKAS